MEIEVISGEIEKFKAGCILLSYFEESEELSPTLASIDKAVEGHISQLVKSGEIKGKSGEISLIHSYGKLPSERVAVIGLGKKSELTADKIRTAAAEALRSLRKKGCTEIAAALPPDTGVIERSNSAGLLLRGHSSVCITSANISPENRTIRT